VRPGDDDKPKEECGIVGVFTPGEESARTAYFALFALQHRGQESAGIAVSDAGRVRFHKDVGLVSQVFTEEAMAALKGEMAVAHTRYSTTGTSVQRNAQPIFCQSVVGDIAVAHNGNLTNAVALRDELEAMGEVLTTSSDSELLARILVRNLDRGPVEAVRAVMERVEGAYSVTVLTPKIVLGFRDPYGVRPLTAGTVGSGYMLASETCAFAPVGGTAQRDLEPGEVAIIDREGMRFEQVVPAKKAAMCLFEFIYFARPDSRMYGTTLYAARERMGRKLAQEHPVHADIVVPVPDSGIPAAHGYSEASGIEYREGMMKSRYIHRTFIAPDQRMREMGVRMKLSPLEDHLKGKRVVLVDDSIVRGTTTKQIVALLKASGAREVHVRITAPPIMWPCFYGIDMCSRAELAAAKMTIDELCADLEADSLGYLSIQGATDSVGEGESRFCLACFNGDYPIPVDEDFSRNPFDQDSGQMSTIDHNQYILFNDDAKE
jgi:amidophosphoribosyltransferase